MTLFVVVAPGETVTLATAVQEAFPNDFLQVNPSTWFIAAEGLTSQQVSDRLGISDAKVGSGIVITVGGYFGRAATNIWEWMAAKSKVAVGG